MLPPDLPPRGPAVQWYYSECGKIIIAAVLFLLVLTVLFIWYWNIPPQFAYEPFYPTNQLQTGSGLVHTHRRLTQSDGYTAGFALFFIRSWMPFSEKARNSMEKPVIRK